MIPDFTKDENYWDFVPLVQEHSKVFDYLLFRGQYRYLFNKLNRDYVVEAYLSIIERDISEDLDRAILYENESVQFDDINEFVRWLNRDNTRDAFKFIYNLQQRPCIKNPTD